jgi:hypothetical protein
MNKSKPSHKKTYLFAVISLASLVLGIGCIGLAVLKIGASSIQYANFYSDNATIPSEQSAEDIHSYNSTDLSIQSVDDVHSDNETSIIINSVNSDSENTTDFVIGESKGYNIE